MKTLALFFLISSALNAIAQLLLKFAAPVVSAIFAGPEGLVIKLFKIVFQPPVIAAALFLFGGMLAWLKILARLDLNQAYPINIALTILFLTAATALIFHEPLTVWRVFGSLLIIAGLFFIFRP